MTEKAAMETLDAQEAQGSTAPAGRDEAAHANESGVAASRIGAFCAALGSSAPSPGGGGACALAGALGAHLGMMVANLTCGKERYRAVEDEVRALRAQAGFLGESLLALADEDARAFAPLARAYKIPKDDPARSDVMQAALETDCEPAIATLEASGDALDVLERLAAIGSRMAVSDVGAGAALCRAALEGAYLNVLINTKPMTNAQRAGALKARAQDLMARHLPRAQALYDSVCDRLVKPNRNEENVRP